MVARAQSYGVEIALGDRVWEEPGRDYILADHSAAREDEPGPRRAPDGRTWSESWRRLRASREAQRFGIPTVSTEDHSRRHGRLLCVRGAARQSGPSGQACGCRRIA